MPLEMPLKMPLTVAYIISGLDTFAKVPCKFKCPDMIWLLYSQPYDPVAHVVI